MRIREVSVKGLFGVFDHSIPMQMEDKITIIHGPNGVGKTVLLKMIHGVFTAQHQVLRSIPYQSFSVTFDDSSELVVRKADDDEQPPETPNTVFKGLVFDFSKGKSKKKFVQKGIKSINRENFAMSLSDIEELIPGVQRSGPRTWLYQDEELSFDDIIERFGHQLPFRIRESVEYPSWLTELRKSIHIRFIEAQRLLRHPVIRRTALHSQRTSMVPSVATYSEELTSEIQAKLAEYGTLSQSLDRTFPTRLVKSQPSSDMTIDDLRNELSSLEEKRAKLVEAGLLDKEKEMDFSVLQKIDEGNRNVLSVYVQDARQKLSVFDDLSNKIDLFKTIVNSRFQYKDIVISGKRHGFTFRTTDHKTLLPTSLSSGEQHELVLFYQLLFKVNPNSLILIDEPELSLHVKWQQQFLKDLTTITKMA